MSGSSSKMSVTQLTLLTALNMMGSGIIMLPTKLAEVGTFSIISWLVTAGGSTALAYAFAKCGMLSRNRGGMGGYAEYAFGKSGSFLANYAYCVSLLIANIAIAISAVGYAVALFGLNTTPFETCLLTIAVLWICTVLNFKGAKITGLISNFTAWGVIIPVAGIIMLPAKFAEIGAISMLSWIVTALASGAVAYVFAQCGMLSKKLGGLGGFAEYAFGEPGAFIVNYAYAISLVFGNIAISLAAVSYGLSWFHLPFSSVFACIGCVLLLWIASLLTFRSPYITGRITGIFVWALLLPLITLVVVGGFWFDPALYSANWNPHQIPTLDAVSSGISMTFWAFLGLESACANAESVENPEKNVPKAVICATLLTAFIYIATTNLTAGLVPNAVILQSDAPFAVVYAALFGGTSGAVVSCLLWLGCAGSLVSWQFTMARVFASSAHAGFFPSIFGQMNKHDAAVKGLILLTGVQSLLCLPILSLSTFTIYEQFTDLAVFITLFAFVICMSGSFALAKAECTSRKRRETIHTIATAAIVMLLGSLYCLNFDTMKIGTVLVCLSWVYYGMLKGRLSASQ